MSFYGLFATKQHVLPFFFTSTIPKVHWKLYSTYVVWLIMLQTMCKVFCMTGDTKLHTG